MRDEKTRSKGRSKERVRCSEWARAARETPEKTLRNTCGHFAALAKTNAKPRQDWVSALD
jgi:hypothetical protein